MNAKKKLIVFYLFLFLENHKVEKKENVPRRFYMLNSHIRSRFARMSSRSRLRTSSGKAFVMLTKSMPVKHLKKKGRTKR
jgi:hypothetical protein